MLYRRIRLAALPVLTALIALAASPAGAERFRLCAGGGGMDCVVDGDTFWLDGQKIRVADIDTPETHQPHCPSERAWGQRATQRLLTLLNAGAFSLEPVERDRDRYGRMLRVVTRDGRSLGAMLVSEGLARPWKGSRQPWCPA